MAKNSIADWDTTAANNTDIGGTDIDEGCAPSGINNAIRELMKQVKDSYDTKALIAATTVAESDFGTLFLASTSTSVTITFPTAASAGEGFEFAALKTIDASHLVLNPPGGETLDGSAAVTLTEQYDFVRVRTDGSNWWTVAERRAAVNEYRLARVRGFASSTTYTPTNGNVRAIEVLMVGGGGGGGYVSTSGGSEYGAGAGGASGSGYHFFITDITSSYSSTLTVGGGGAGGSTGPNAATAGGSTRWNDGNTDLTAGGGGAGSSANGSTSRQLTQRGNRAPNTQTSVGSTTTVIISVAGSDAEDGISIPSETYAKGGAGGAGPLGWGSREGGSTQFGTGAFGGGSSASNYGNGGSGGAIAATAGGFVGGGDGSSGYIIVREYV